MFKGKFLFLCIAAFVIGSTFVAQNSPEPQRSNRDIVNFIVSLQEKRIVEIAEVMPAEKYSFKPGSAGFKGVRTFGEELRHIAVDNYVLGAGILGEKPPVEVGPGEDGPADIRSKDQVLSYLKASFTYMHRATAAIDDANLTVPTPEISPWPQGTATRLGLAIEDCVHTWDHYGQLVEYLRMNGIVPPASRK